MNKSFKITILDYGCGNILSLKRGLERVGFKSEITSDHKHILNSNFLVLPGVGAFNYAMNLLKEKNLVEILRKYIQNKEKKILGVCLGMQLLLTKSFEMGEHKGLDFIEGDVVRIDKNSKIKNLKVPHVSWNQISHNLESKNISEITNQIINKDFYFVHSYMSITKKKDETIALCKYFDVDIPAVIRKENIIGCQFHPEKSGINGHNFLKTIISSNEF